MRPPSGQKEITNLSHLRVMIDRGPIIDESGKGQEVVDTTVIKAFDSWPRVKMRSNAVST
jgi:hypothetical protein